MKKLTAKLAKEITEKSKNIVKKSKVIKELTINQKIKNEIKYHTQKILLMAKDGKDYYQECYPESETIFNAISKHFEKLGFSVGYFEDDFGTPGNETLMMSMCWKY